MKKLVFSLIFVNFLLINYNSFLFSKIINQKSINSNKVKIKVASFSTQESLTLAQENFKNYDIYLEYKEKFVRFFIVNIPKSRLKERLKEIRKDFPDAFVYKRILNRNSICLTEKVVVNQNRFKTENNQKKQINFLNSDTILQTRKKFY